MSVADIFGNCCLEKDNNLLYSLIKFVLVLFFSSFFSGCVATHHVAQKGELDALKKQVQAQNRHLASLASDRFFNALVLQGIRNEISSLRLDVAALEKSEPAQPPPSAEPAAKSSASPQPPPSAESAAKSSASPQDQQEGFCDGKTIIGTVEKVFLSPPGILLPARIDTGAETSSLDARDLRDFERDGKDWVRFILVDPETEEEIEVERPVARYVRILQSATEESERRAVVKLRFVIGSVSRSAEFTLSNREHLEYPLLIGRNILQDVMMVDVGRSFTVKPQTQAPSK